MTTEASAPVDVSKLKLWCVTCERRSELDMYVLAESSEKAEADAEELMDRGDWYDYDTDFYGREVRKRGSVPPKETVWVGGEHGHDITIEELDAYLASLREEQRASGYVQPIPGQMALDGSIYGETGDSSGTDAG